MWLKHCNKFNFSRNLLVNFLNLTVAVFIITVSAASTASTQEKAVSDPINDVRWDKMKDVLTRLLENDQATDEALSSLTNKISEIMENERDISDLSSELQADSKKLSIAEQQIQSLKQELADMELANGELRNIISEIASQVSSLADATKLNTEFREVIEETKKYKVMEDDQGLAKLFETSLLSQITVNFPLEADCPAIGTWLIDIYVKRVRNSLFVSNGEEIKICEYENGSWKIRSARFDDRSHVVHIDE